MRIICEFFNSIIPVLILNHFLEELKNIINNNDNLNNMIPRKNLFISLIIFVLILIIGNVPPIEAVPSFKLLDTAVGNITLPRLLLIISLLLCIIYLIKYNSIIKINFVDFSLYLLSILSLVNYYLMTSLFYFVLMIIGGYTIGRILGISNYESIIINSIKVAGIIQVFLVLYSMFISPFEFSAVEGRDLFKSFNSKTEDSSLRATGTIGHPVVLAAVLIPSFICWFYDLLFQKSKVKKAYAVLAFISTTICIILTYSRGTWISLIFVLFYILYNKKLLKNIKIWFLGLIVLISLLISPYGTKLIDRFSLLSNFSDGSVSHRFYMYYWSGKEILKNPLTLFFGNGVGSTYSLLKENPPPDYFLVIDNTYLTFLVEMGLIGFLILLIILRKAIYNKTFQVDLIGFIILALSLNGLTFDLYYWEQLSILLWILIGFQISKNLNSKFKY